MLKKISRWYYRNKLENIYLHSQNPENEAKKLNFYFIKEEKNSYLESLKKLENYNNDNTHYGSSNHTNSQNNSLQIKRMHFKFIKNDLKNTIYCEEKLNLSEKIFNINKNYNKDFYKYIKKLIAAEIESVDPILEEWPKQNIPEAEASFKPIELRSFAHLKNVWIRDENLKNLNISNENKAELSHSLIPKKVIEKIYHTARNNNQIDCNDAAKALITLHLLEKDKYLIQPKSFFRNILLGQPVKESVFDKILKQNGNKEERAQAYFNFKKSDINTKITKNELKQVKESIITNEQPLQYFDNIKNLINLSVDIKLDDVIRRTLFNKPLEVQKKLIDGLDKLRDIKDDTRWKNNQKEIINPLISSNADIELYKEVTAFVKNTSKISNDQFKVLYDIFSKKDLEQQKNINEAISKLNPNANYPIHKGITAIVNHDKPDLMKEGLNKFQDKDLKVKNFNYYEMLEKAENPSVTADKIIEVRVFFKDKTSKVVEKALEEQKTNSKEVKKGLFKKIKTQADIDKIHAAAFIIKFKEIPASQKAKYISTLINESQNASNYLNINKLEKYSTSFSITEEEKTNKLKSMLNPDKNVSTNVFNEINYKNKIFNFLTEHRSVNKDKAVEMIKQIPLEKLAIASTKVSSIIKNLEQGENNLTLENFENSLNSLNTPTSDLENGSLYSWGSDFNDSELEDENEVEVTPNLDDTQFNTCDENTYEVIDQSSQSSQGNTNNNIENHINILSNDDNKIKQEQNVNSDNNCLINDNIESFNMKENETNLPGIKNTSEEIVNSNNILSNTDSNITNITETTNNEISQVYTESQNDTIILHNNVGFFQDNQNENNENSMNNNNTANNNLDFSVNLEEAKTSCLNYVPYTYSHLSQQNKKSLSENLVKNSENVITCIY